MMPSLSKVASRLEVRLLERLETLASTEGLAKTDVFCSAIALHLLVKEREEAGASSSSSKMIRANVW